MEKRREAEGIETFRFSSNMHFKAGQYIMIELDIEPEDPRGNDRQFSISSSPTEKGYIEITTKLSESPFKKRLAELKKVEEVRIKGPMGSFGFQKDTERPAVMIAGGIGITPFISMMKYLTINSSPAQITLLYSNKTPEEIAFRKDLEQLEKSNKNLCVIHTITRPGESKQQWTGKTGRIDAGFIGENADIEKSIFYICGPPAMVDSMINILKSLEISDDRIHVERFIGY